jgi:hypothetical protein
MAVTLSGLGKGRALSPKLPFISASGIHFS